ncbi:two-component system sensor histidine kinase KdpD [Friedmanniella endophytica]|uniref:histidine kinase n=1 Tax=Microlunatus kandeliicorticis TaxID=1759536 RepID=A0A7W3IR28_9ACTN|nr:DUF4118 domain-containing protein [Microlunatus kandeliicorticis]MBA8793706.1 two-component system sensor histidine kinase KdpD [Microlunatus kandeliicorticis]
MGGERGRLRVYLGAAPGVGKTFAMLDEGHRRAERGTDVVIGLVETHGRARTEAEIGDLEVVPRREVTYHGLTTTELDVEAVLARAPEVALVDELAHTIVRDPNDGRDTGHTKRWQDVELLLDHGIDVITTLNVQHLESLNDVVASITGVRQAETVPDAVVRAADAVELVDMSPQSLRRRMAHGNIYPAEKVDTALSRYFREGNLAALRELALLWLADRVEEGLDRYRDSHGIGQTWATRERLVVGLSGGSESLALMRRAARIASRTTGGEWVAVYVTRRDGLSGVTPDRLEELRRQAADLGGSFRAVVAVDVPEGLLDFARAENATQVLVGASRRGRLSALLRPGIGETVIADSGDIDVHVVTHDHARGHATRRRRATVSRRRVIAGYLLAVLGTAALSGLLELTTGWHGLPTETMVMMALVVATALVGGLWPAVLAAVVSSLALNLLFVPPIGTLTIAQPENAFAIGVFLVTGVAVATVVDRAARQTELARRARAESNALAVLAHGLLHSSENAAAEEGGVASVTGPSDPGATEEELALLREACRMFQLDGAAVFADGRLRAGYGEAPRSVTGADLAVPVTNGVVLAFNGPSVSAGEQRLLKAFAAHLAVITERRRSRAESARARELAATEKTRTALLGAVSHDLRSPLAAIKAAAASLRSSEVAWSPADEAELLATIEDSADRLDALVENLLDMSRLQTGAVRPLLADIDLAAVCARALDSAGLAEPGDGRTPPRVTWCEPPDELPSARGDQGLIERVIVNVVENAVRYSPPGRPVQLRLSQYRADGRDWVSLRVIDHGPGVPAAGFDRLFAPFQRLGDVPNGDGLGLGLAVSRGLAEATGGTLTAEETPGGGLTMVLDLPSAPSADDQPAEDRPTDDQSVRVEEITRAS